MGDEEEQLWTEVHLSARPVNLAMSAQEGLGEQVQPLYISAACSRSNSSAARPQDGLVAFASGHLIALWKSAVRPPDDSLQST